MKNHENEEQNYPTSLKLQQGHEQNRINALPPPGKAPYGYRRGKDRYIIDRSTAPVIKDFFEQFLLFGSLRGAVKYLDKRYGKKISVSTGHRWLNHPVYRGDLIYQNQDIIPDTHIAIISREEAAQIDRLLRRNQKLPPKTASAPRSLAGLVMCQKCQSSMSVSCTKIKNKRQQYLYLRPNNCPLNPTCKLLDYQEILQQIIEKICQDLPRTVASLNIPDPEIIRNNIQEAINNKQEIINQLPDLIKTEILDSETAALRRYKLQTEIAQLRAKIEQLPPGNLNIIAQAVSLPQFWQDLSEAERRFYFREFIQQVQLIPISPKTWEIKLVFVF